MSSTTDEGKEGRYDLALQEARRGFDEQAAHLSQMRGRVPALAGFGSVTFSVLVAVGSAAESQIGTVLLSGATAAFVAMILCCIGVLWPRKVVPSALPHVLVEWAETPAVTADEMTKQLASRIGTAYNTNKPQLEQVTRLFMVALGSFATAVLLLSLRLLIGA